MSNVHVSVPPNQFQRTQFPFLAHDDCLCMENLRSILLLALLLPFITIIRYIWIDVRETDIRRDKVPIDFSCAAIECHVPRVTFSDAAPVRAVRVCGFCRIASLFLHTPNQHWFKLCSKKAPLVLIKMYKNLLRMLFVAFRLISPCTSIPPFAHSWKRAHSHSHLCSRFIDESNGDLQNECHRLINRCLFAQWNLFAVNFHSFAFEWCVRGSQQVEQYALCIHASACNRTKRATNQKHRQHFQYIHYENAVWTICVALWNDQIKKTFGIDE